MPNDKYKSKMSMLITQTSLLYTPMVQSIPSVGYYAVHIPELHVSLKNNLPPRLHLLLLSATLPSSKP